MIPYVPHFSDLMEWLPCPSIMLQQPHGASYCPWKQQEHSYMWALLLLVPILLFDEHSQQLSVWLATQISPNKLVLPSPSLSIPFN